MKSTDMKKFGHESVLIGMNKAGHESGRARIGLIGHEWGWARIGRHESVRHETAGTNKGEIDFLTVTCTEIFSTFKKTYPLLHVY